MNIVLLGPPGAGKGTQAVDIAKSHKLCHISTGDILRQAVREGTPTGLKAKEFMDKGALVPDEVVVDIVSEALSGGACKDGWILDGFPRTMKQAEELGKKTKKLGIRGVDVVFYFSVDDDTVVKRLSGRRMCKQCGTSYHTEFMPPKKEGVCDRCGGQLYQRDDDKPDTVKKRLVAYRNDTEPLIGYYRKKKLLEEVEGNASPGAVRRTIEDAMARRQR
jgi:adenylate kinase